MKKKKLGLTLKISLIIASFLLITDIVMAIVFLNLSTNKTKEILNHKMLEIAQTAAKLVDGDDIKVLTIEDKENQTERYVKNYNILSAFKTSAQESEADLAYIYCLIKLPDDRIVFSIDPSDNPGLFLEEEPIYTAAMVAATNGIAGVDEAPLTDRWGSLYSAYAPIFTSTGEVAGVIGVDVWARWYDEQIKVNVFAIVLVSVVTITSGVFLSLLITNKIRRKMNSLTDEMSSLEKEVQTLLLEIKGTDEISIPTNSDGDEMTILKDRIIFAQNELREYIKYNEQKAYTDSLTGIGNRLAYFERVKAINESIKDKTLESLLVVVFDVDGLKDINDAYGHEFGDLVLTVSGGIIKEVYGLNNSYRIGGDEIVIILENTPEEDLIEKKTLFDQLLKEANESRKLKFEMSLSYGFDQYKVDEDKEFLDVFRRADKNMYENKKIHHNKK